MDRAERYGLERHGMEEQFGAPLLIPSLAGRVESKRELTGMTPLCSPGSTSLCMKAH